MNTIVNATYRLYHSLIDVHNSNEWARIRMIKTFMTRSRSRFQNKRLTVS